MKKFITAILVFVAFAARATDIEGDSVLLRSVDKITGRTHTTEIKIGETAVIGNLKITPERCLKNPPEETPEDAAFILVEESNKENDDNTVFNGWMFSSNPAISAMEHPIWDIWVLACQTADSDSDKTIKKVQSPTLTVKPVDVEELEEI